MRKRNAKLIVVEGPDSTGKTSLARFLAREAKAMYYHASGHPLLHHSMPAYHQSIVTNVEFNINNGLHVVLDRHWPSEWVYAGLFRPVSFSLYPFDKFTSQLERLGVTYVFCDSEYGLDRHRHTHSDQDHQYDADKYQLIQQRYRDLRMMIDEPVFEYSIEKHGHDLKEYCRMVLSL